jgi:transcriptional regulator with XRE-family HTH domain
MVPQFAMRLRERVAWNLRAARTARKITQESLAVDADVDRTTISGLERGDFNASLDLMEKLAAALDIDSAELFAIPPADTPPPQALKPGRKSSR